jgi:hypothetical protein
MRDLSQLDTGLRAEYVEADRHDAEIRTEFESWWVAVDMESVLRTESWASSAASVDRLSGALDAQLLGVQQVLTADSSTEHRWAPRSQGVH